MDPQLYTRLIFDKAGKIQGGGAGETVSSTDGVGKIGQPHAEE